MSGDRRAKLAAKPVDPNAQLWPQLKEQLGSTKTFLRASQKLWKFVQIRKGFYPAARPKIVLLLETGQETLCKAAGHRPFHISACPSNLRPLGDIYWAILSKVAQFVEAFKDEPDLRGRVESLVATLSADAPTNAVPGPSRTDAGPAPSSRSSSSAAQHVGVTSQSGQTVPPNGANKITATSHTVTSLGKKEELISPVLSTSVLQTTSSRNPVRLDALRTPLSIPTSSAPALTPAKRKRPSGATVRPPALDIQSARNFTISSDSPLTANPLVVPLTPQTPLSSTVTSRRGAPGHRANTATSVITPSSQSAPSAVTGANVARVRSPSIEILDGPPPFFLNQRTNSNDSSSSASISRKRPHLQPRKSTTQRAPDSPLVVIKKEPGIVSLSRLRDLSNADGAAAAPGTNMSRTQRPGLTASASSAPLSAPASAITAHGRFHASAPTSSISQGDAMDVDQPVTAPSLEGALQAVAAPAQVPSRVVPPAPAAVTAGRKASVSGQQNPLPSISQQHLPPSATSHSSVAGASGAIAPVIASSISTTATGVPFASTAIETGSPRKDIRPTTATTPLAASPTSTSAVSPPLSDVRSSPVSKRTVPSTPPLPTDAPVPPPGQITRPNHRPLVPAGSLFPAAHAAPQMSVSQAAARAQTGAQATAATALNAGSSGQAKGPLSASAPVVNPSPGPAHSSTAATSTKPTPRRKISAQGVATTFVHFIPPSSAATSSQASPTATASTSRPGSSAGLQHVSASPETSTKAKSAKAQPKPRVHKKKSSIQADFMNLDLAWYQKKKHGSVSEPQESESPQVSPSRASFKTPSSPGKAAGLVHGTSPPAATSKTAPPVGDDADLDPDAQARLAREAEAKRAGEAEERARREAESRSLEAENARMAREHGARLAREATERTRLKEALEESDRIAVQKARQRERLAKEAAEKLAKEAQEKRAREERERLAKEAEEELARETEEKRAREARERIAKEAEETRAREDRERIAKEAEEKRTREDRERIAKEAEEKRTREERERVVKQAEDKRAREDRERVAKEAEEKRAREDRERIAKEAEEKRTREERERVVKQAEEERAREERERVAKEAEDKRAQEEREKLAKETEAKRAQQERERLAREAEEKRARDAEEKCAREERERVAKEAEEKRAREEREKLAKEVKAKRAQEKRERLAREAEEKRARDAEEKRVRGEQERLAREAEAKRTREEEKKRAQEERNRLAREEDAKRAREAEDTRVKEAEEKRVQEERERLALEEQEKVSREAEEKRAREKLAQEQEQERQARLFKEAEEKAAQEERDRLAQTERELRSQAQEKAEIISPCTQAQVSEASDANTIPLDPKQIASTATTTPASVRPSQEAVDDAAREKERAERIRLAELQFVQQKMQLPRPRKKGQDKGARGARRGGSVKDGVKIGSHTVATETQKAASGVSAKVSRGGPDSQQAPPTLPGPSQSEVAVGRSCGSGPSGPSTVASVAALSAANDDDRRSLSLRESQGSDMDLGSDRASLSVPPALSRSQSASVDPAALKTALDGSEELANHLDTARPLALSSGQTLDPSTVLYHRCFGSPEWGATVAFDLDIDAKHAEGIARWNNRWTNPRDAANFWCMTITCYAIKDWTCALTLPSDRSAEDVLAQLTCVWPPRRHQDVCFRVVNDLGEGTFDLGKSMMTADDWFDLSPLLCQGRNTVEIRHLRPLDEYMFIVRGNRPTSAQCEEMNHRQLKEEQAVSWSAPTGESFQDIFARLAKAAGIVS